MAKFSYQKQIIKIPHIHLYLSKYIYDLIQYVMYSDCHDNYHSRGPFY